MKIEKEKRETIKCICQMNEEIIVKKLFVIKYNFFKFKIQNKMELIFII